MSIIKNIRIKEEGSKAFNRLTSPNDYWVVVYDSNLNVVFITVYDEEVKRKGAFTGGTVTDASTIHKSFRANTYEELLTEANRLKLKFPT